MLDRTALRRGLRWWLLGASATPFLILIVAVSRGTIAPRPATPGTEYLIARLIEEHRASQTEALARSELGRVERDQGPDSLRTAEAIDHLLRVAAVIGDRASLPADRQLAERSIAIKRRLLGDDRAEVADSLSAYEWLLWNFEEYSEARPYAEQAVAIRTKALGARHRSTASSLYQLAEIHRMLGDYSSARRIHEQALAIWETTPELDASSIANSLYYLGVIRWMTGDYRGARAHIGRSLSIRESTEGPASDLVATCLNSLGSLDLRMGDRAGAMSLFKRAEEIWKKTLGVSSPQLARSVENQGILLLEDGDYPAAKRLLDLALRIRTEAFGPDHYLVARSLAELARVASAAGHHLDADRLFRRALKIQQADPQARGPELAETLVENGRLAWKTGDRERSMELSLNAEALARQDFLRTSRGMAEQEALRYETVRSHGLDVALTNLVSRASAAPSRRSPDAVARVWDEEIRSRALVLDEIAGRGHETAAAERYRPGLREVAAHLPAHAALVAYVRYTSLEMSGVESVARYLAFVQSSGVSRPAVVPLGTVAEIEPLVQTWRSEAGKDPRLDPAGGGEARYRDAGARLRAAIWDPVAAALRDRRYVFVVPDGAVNLVSLAALPLGDGRYLIDDPLRIHYLSAERDLVTRQTASSREVGLLAIGGADFDAPPPAGPAAYRGATPACLSFESLRFAALPGSRREAEEVASLWKDRANVLVLSGADAAEGTFKRTAPGRTILHLATHGYSLDDRCVSMLEAPRAAEGSVTVGDNPLLLSGLALAGANRREEARGADDGILTAEEIGSMDLSRVEWAVLSGCDTGLGQVMQGEGVLGLRRAFQVAGAGTLIMSLWPVDDGAARVWMRHLYEGRLTGQSTIEAVSHASLWMLEDQRRRGRATHPYYWGAFVAAGDWR